MTTRLEQAFAEANKLPPQDQDLRRNGYLPNLNPKNAGKALANSQDVYPDWQKKHF